MEPKEILERYNTIAVVGLSRDPSKSAYSVPRTLQAAGFRIIPVNPYADTLLGEKVYRRLGDIPEPIDIVEVFRPAVDAPDVARQAVAAGAKVLWLQLGIVSAEARVIAEAAGLVYVEDRCMAVERAIHRITKQPAAR
jgi:predicted CoA-binding protein